MTRLLWLVVVASGGLGAAVWVRSWRFRRRLLAQLEATSGDADLKRLARSGVQRDGHAVLVYGVVTLVGLVGAATGASAWVAVALALVMAPTALTVGLGRQLIADARLEMRRGDLERRAQEVLVQEELAPRRWAERLAPSSLASVEGLTVGSAYQPGAGMLAGDFFDVVPLGGGRVGMVIGDVAGHGIEPAITAFQTKYLLRTLLRQFRDPAQAVEELNRQMGSSVHGEEFVSLFVAVHDPHAGTLRHCSAGHPPAVLWHDRDIQLLGATGPLLLLDPSGSYYAHEQAFDAGDVLVAYTDGLAEARDGDDLFGEERIATTLRRDPGQTPELLCKALLEAASDHASSPITDDVAILAIRRD